MKLFSTSTEEALGHDLKTIGTGSLDVPRIEGLLEKLATKSGATENFELEVKLPRLGLRKLIFNAVDIPQEAGDKRKILLAIDDIAADNSGIR